jgi:hypothetical protein
LIGDPGWRPDAGDDAGGDHYPFVLGGISVLGAICGIIFVNVGGGKRVTH